VDNPCAATEFPAENHTSVTDSVNSSVLGKSSDLVSSSCCNFFRLDALHFSQKQSPAEILEILAGNNP
jgi:hypothetical protein